MADRGVRIVAMGRRLTVLLLASLLAGCESRDVTTDLKIVNVQTGWYDLGIVEGGQNKLVPSITLSLQNVSDRDIASVPGGASTSSGPSTRMVSRPAPRRTRSSCARRSGIRERNLA
jgi:hypothetical protein